MTGRLMTQQEFEEWGADDFLFPWMDCISTNQFAKLNIPLGLVIA